MVFLIDSQIYDKIVADTDFQRRLEALLAAGRFRMLSTHVQEDEINQTPNVAKRAALQSVNTEKVPTMGVVVGVSQIDQARISSDEVKGLRFEEIRRGNLKHTEDALIATTAAQEADVLVTDDITLQKRVRSQPTKIEVWDFEQFKNYVDSL